VCLRAHTHQQLGSQITTQARAHSAAVGCVGCRLLRFVGWRTAHTQLRAGCAAQAPVACSGRCHLWHIRPGPLPPVFTWPPPRTACRVDSAQWHLRLSLAPRGMRGLCTRACWLPPSLHDHPCAAGMRCRASSQYPAGRSCARGCDPAGPGVLRGALRVGALHVPGTAAVAGILRLHSSAN
jgi:hypothetical protein